MNKICDICGNIFEPNKYAYNQKRCGKECIIEYRKQYNSKHREKLNEQMRLNNIKRNMQIKIEVMNHYGGGKCACCGEDRIEFLTLDHENGDGAEHRKKHKKVGSGIKFYGPGEWLMRKHGPSKRRKWRKVHIALDPKSQKEDRDGCLAKHRYRSPENRRQLDP